MIPEANLCPWNLILEQLEQSWLLDDIRENAEMNG